MDGVMNTSDIKVNINVGTNLKQHAFDQAIKHAIHDSGVDISLPGGMVPVTLDWSNIEYVDLSTLIWAIILLEQLKSRGYRVSLNLPQPKQGQNSERIWSFLNRWHFFDALKCVDHPSNLLSEDLMSYLALGQKMSRYGEKYITDEDGNLQPAIHEGLMAITNLSLRRDDADQIINEERFVDFVEKWKHKIILRALMKWCGWNEDDATRFVTCIIYESMQNAVEHSDGTLVLTGFNVDNRHIVLCVADNGAGIPATLRTAFKNNPLLCDKATLSDAQLIKHFADPEMILDSEYIKIATVGGSSSKTAKAGMGLYYFKKMILEKGGQLRIRSGQACVEFTGSDSPSTDSLFNAPGTSLRVIFPRKTSV